MLIWGSIIILGSISYMILSDGEVKEKEIIEEVKENNNYDKTYLYFSNLTLDEQIEYVNYNLDLRDYKDTLTNNKHFNSKRIASISEKLNKEFTNKNKRY